MLAHLQGRRGNCNLHITQSAADQTGQNFFQDYIDAVGIACIHGPNKASASLVNILMVIINKADTHAMRTLMLKTSNH